MFRHNIVAEGLSNATHVKGEHSKGMLIHDNVTQIAIVGNLFHSNMQRNPIFKGGTRAILANNVIHNPGRWAIHYALVRSEWDGRELIPGRLVIAGNMVQFGPDTPRELPIGNFIGGAEVSIHDNRLLTPATLDVGIPWVGQFTEITGTAVLD